LVDMERDPGETQNLVGNAEYGEVLLEHRRILAEFCQTNGDNFPYVP